MLHDAMDDNEVITQPSYETTMWSWCVKETSHWSI